MLARPSARTALGWLRHVDIWELVTGIYVFVFIAAADFSQGPWVVYAQRFVTMTILCEFAMGLISLFVRTAAKDVEQRKRTIKMLFAAFFYAVCMAAIAIKVKAFWMLPQAIWIFYGRLRPPSGIAILSKENISRFVRSAVACFVVVFMQVFVIGLATVAANALGLQRQYGDTVGAPMWIYALVYGAMYVEFAFLLPLVEAVAKVRPAAITSPPP